MDYSEKLTEILRQNNIKSVTVVRMEVPCCGGLEYAVRTALQNCGKLLPWQVKTISIKANCWTIDRFLSVSLICICNFRSKRVE